MTTPLSNHEWLKICAFLAEVRRLFGKDAKIVIRPSSFDQQKEAPNTQTDFGTNDARSNRKVVK